MDNPIKVDDSYRNHDEGEASNKDIYEFPSSLTYNLLGDDKIDTRIIERSKLVTKLNSQN